MEKLGGKNAKFDLSVVYDVLVEDLKKAGLLNETHDSVTNAFREKYLEFPPKAPTKDGQLKLGFVEKEEPGVFEGFFFSGGMSPRPLFCLCVPTSKGGEEKFYKKEDFFPRSEASLPHCDQEISGRVSRSYKRRFILLLEGLNTSLCLSWDACCIQLVL